MITETGYSKDIIEPESIVMTLGSKMIEDKGGLLHFLQWFEYCLSDEDGLFYLRCKNGPRYENINYVYLIVANRLYGRVNYGGYYKKDTVLVYEKPDSGDMTLYPYSVIAIAGPIVKPGFKRTLRGFQGFRYGTKLF